MWESVCWCYMAWMFHLFHDSVSLGFVHLNCTPTVGTTLLLLHLTQHNLALSVAFSILAKLCDDDFSHNLINNSPYHYSFDIVIIASFAFEIVVYIIIDSLKITKSCFINQTNDRKMAWKFSHANSNSCTRTLTTSYYDGLNTRNIRGQSKQLWL